MRSELGFTALAFLAIAAAGCSSGERENGGRVAILPFENLSSDAGLNWVGRAFAEDLRLQLTGVDGMSPAVVVALRDVPASGAGRVVQGYFSVVKGRLQARAVVEQANTSRTLRSVPADGPLTAGMLPIADSLARQVAAGARPLATKSADAMRAFALAAGETVPAAAGEAFQRAISADPSFAAAYLSWAERLIALRDRPRAAAVLAAARGHSAQFPVIERERLNYLSAAIGNDPAGQKRALTALATLEPGDPGVPRALGDLDASAHAYAAAVSWYEKAVQRDPRDVLAWNSLGYARSWAGDLDGAIKAFAQYSDLHPNEANPFDSMGDAYYYAGRWGDAAKYYAEANRKNPSFLGGGELYKAAWARLMAGDLKEADAAFGAFLQARAAARDITAPYRQAQWEFLTGRRKQAIDRLETYAKSAPLPAASLALSQLTLWSLDLGDRARASEFANRVPGSGPLVTLARLLTAPPAGANEWAARIGRALPLATEPGFRRHVLSVALLYSGEFAAAAPVLAALYRDLPPTSPDRVEVEYAWALVESGNTADASGPLRFNPVPDATAEHPLLSLSFPRVLYLRGVVAEKQGRADDAKRSYELFLRYSGQIPLAFGEEQRAKAALARP